MDAAPQTFVIVGAGLAAAKAAEALRDEGFDGKVLMIGSEPERPYERSRMPVDADALADPGTDLDSLLATQARPAA